MKIERLIGILSVLLQKAKVTAPDLSNESVFPGGIAEGVAEIYKM